MPIRFEVTASCGRIVNSDHNMSTDDVLDQEAIAELRDVAGDQLASVLRDYLINGARYESRILAARARLDWDDLCEVVHNMKGSYGYVGATKLVRQCGELQRLIREDHDDIQKRLKLSGELLDEFRQVRRALGRLIPPD
ncbi:MAG: hypothetical protein Tsb002_09990 [Wenzhouxiangellaceae bacterium]